MTSGVTNNKNEHVFRDMPVAMALWTFALPSIISQLILLAYNLADTFFLGRVGNPYMVAAVSLVLPVYNICIAFANLCGVGGGTLIARLLGAQEHEEAKRVSAFSALVSVVLSAMFSLGIYAFRTPLLLFLGASEATMDFASQYIFWVLVVGGVPAVLAMTLANLARNAGLAKEAGIGAGGMGILNIILDPVFMFVLLPPGMEVIGAAMATTLSLVINVIYFAWIFRVNRNKSVLRIFPLRGLPSRRSVSQIISVGVPAGMTVFLYDLTNIVICKLSATHGDVALAAIGIVLKAERLPLNICVGICLGMVPLIGYNFAAGNLDRMRRIYYTAVVCGLSVSAVCIVLYECFAGGIMKVFIDNAETVELGTAFLRVRCLATFMMFASFNFCHFFQGIGMGRHSFMLAAIRQLGFNIPLLFLFDSIFGMYGIIWTQFTADAFTALISAALFKYVERRSWGARVSRT